MGWLVRLFRSQGLALVVQIVLVGSCLLFLLHALSSVGDPDGWVRVLQRVVPVAFVVFVAAFRFLQRPIPALDSGNPYVSALGWVVVGYLAFGTMFLSATYRPPLIAWIQSGILAYVVIVVVQQIRQQPPE